MSLSKVDVDLVNSLEAAIGHKYNADGYRSKKVFVERASSSKVDKETLKKGAKKVGVPAADLKTATKEEVCKLIWDAIAVKKTTKKAKPAKSKSNGKVKVKSRSSGSSSDDDSSSGSESDSGSDTGSRLTIDDVNKAARREARRLFLEVSSGVKSVQKDVKALENDIDDITRRSRRIALE